MFSPNSFSMLRASYSKGLVLDQGAQPICESSHQIGSSDMSMCISIGRARVKSAPRVLPTAFYL